MARPVALSALLGSALFCATPVFAQAPAEVTEEAAAEETDSDADRPWSASLTLESSLGRSSFASNAYDRNVLWNLYVLSEVGWTLLDALDLSAYARFDFDSNLMETSDSESTHKQQVRAGDLVLGVSGASLGSWLDESLTWSGGSSVILPTSLLSRFTRKSFGLDVSTGVSWDALPWLSVSYGATFGKNFHRSTTAALDQEDFALPPVTRAGGAEALGEGLVAVAGASTSFWVDHVASLSFSFLDRGSATISYELLHSFGYDAFPADELASPYADPGRGRSDLSYGTLEVGWELTDNLSLALGSLLAQAPKHADNQGLRFPFWDTTNGAANRQVFYLDVIGTY